MKCPNCGANESHVIESRRRPDFIYRRRRCVKCGCRFITHETVIRPCSDWTYGDKTRVLSFPQLRTWQEALWIETKSYGGNLMFATSIRSIIDNCVRFENDQVRTVGLYGKQWRAWTKRPTQADLKKEVW